jgi:hypothetical protein
MANEPMPWQMTVGQLRQVLRDVPDEAVVALRVPASGLDGGGEVGSVFYNLRVEYGGGVVVQFVPLAATSPGDPRKVAG